MKLRWTNQAKAELAQIQRFSKDRWGTETAKAYLTDIRNAARAIAADQASLRPLRPPFSIKRVRSHYLIVHINNENRILTVARVLHTSMDVGRHLGP